MHTISGYIASIQNRYTRPSDSRPVKVGKAVMRAYDAVTDPQPKNPGYPKKR